MATTTFNIGGMTVHRIIEMECGLTPALEFLPKLTPQMLDESRDWLRAPRALDEADRLVLCFQSYVVRTGRHVVLVDSCIGNDKDRPTRPMWHRKKDTVFMQGLADVGLTVNDVDFVLCTHLHVDHVGWNTRLENGRWVPTFPNARYVFSKKELDYWLAENDKATVPPIADSVIPIVEAKRCDLVTSDHALSDVMTLIPTPGHTIDHYAVTLGKGGRDAVITGDLIHSPLQAKWPDLAAWIDYDPVQSTATRRKFLETYCDTDTQCCFAHFPSPSRGYVKRWGDGFRCDYVGG
ncbi:MBL fold metallo-hydrolase [Rhodopila globiformis]|uniref:MBL fold metallo-hydrolase n=1 Tax=Rhodopila globiformis TaxID=1071 RepID=A0A2S6NJ18_RHOGL|nr:MBL fold metallo-hydrolase [Rhodopila globiformis]PPQ34637.1 MBL fold metallo-hydrolase [Rhodopila globiformis]